MEAVASTMEPDARKDTPHIPGPSSAGGDYLAAVTITDLGQDLWRRRLIDAESGHPNHDRNATFTSIDLERALDEKLVDSTYRRGLVFLPNGEIPRLLDETVIQTKLTSLRQRSLSGFMQTVNLSTKTSPVEPAINRDALRLARTICGADEPQTAKDSKASSSPTTPKKSYFKIFAILVLIGWPTQIQHFVEEGVCDADLPLVRVKTPHMSLTPWELRRKEALDTPLQCFKTDSLSGLWRRHVTVRSFESTQWQFLAPFFCQDDKERPYHFELPKRAILPFTSSKRLPLTSGFGIVFKVEIHPDHHRFCHDLEGDQHVQAPHQVGRVFAVKQLHSKEKEDFQREFTALRLLSSHSRRQEHHLISLLASYEQRGYYHFIFPCADSNLCDYWKNKEPERDFPNCETAGLWLIDQCHGLARGLATIHRLGSFSPILHSGGVTGHQTTLHESKALKNAPTVPTGGTDPETRTICCRHGDIKPHNILWFPDPVRGSTLGMGALKITDFGTAELLEKDGMFKSRNKAPTSFMYEPPEAISPRSDVLCNSYDIWGLGCVFLEFMAWYLGNGWGGVEKFLDKRLPAGNPSYGVKIATFFSKPGVADSEDSRTAVVNPGVHKFIEHSIESNSKCTHFFKKFLEMVRDDMLVIENGGGVGRKSAASIAARIFELEKEAGLEKQRDCPVSELVPDGN
ncbi:kinase-like domain-containing protein [Immersiella caudata]|uniref:Kinase-like domain-containing protein n=1 Tax=Immersiella caudata TaxID=314043 RepID=A0AA40BU36_9PEZI|nr:kinase-like domain-containing protein [Immersiella caudata]